MTRTRPRAVGEYLRRLERSLKDLPADRRSEIVAEIEEHIEGRLAELGDEPGDAQIRNVLERVGDPDALAEEAKERFGITPRRSRWTDTAAVILLPIPFLGWITAPVLIWMSDVWSAREKILGTAAGLGMVVLGALTTMATSSGGEAGGPVPAGTVEEPPASGTGVAEVLVLILVFLVPLIVAIYLGHRLRRAR